jgi:signal transduction histidine kinase
MENVVSSAEHLLALINDVLDISKIEAGSLQLFKESTDLTQLLFRVESTARSLLHEKPVRFTTDIDPHLPIVAADTQRISQVILNIISNACKFTKEGEIHLSACVQDNTILVTVKDTGPGIVPEEHSAVFEKFKQTSAGLRQGGGTGLGMPISKSLIEAHGGQMWLESKLGHGASFKFTLPISTEKV